MKHFWSAAALVLAGMSSLLAQPPAGQRAGIRKDADALPVPDYDTVPPRLAREMRGVWVATVGNMDWPSRPGLSTAQQKSELLAILDRSAALHLNAVIFQVRPAGDALYRSTLEPWSEVLTGIMGQSPSPAYDPLAFAIDESHKRGMELHAWFNPYRARTPGMKSSSARTHVSREHPDWVRRYGTHLWMDPGVPAVRQHTIDVVLDVVRRYDLDGVHIDDYFYPYRENDPRTRREIEFPDAATYRKYQRNGGRLALDDWRRENVNTLVRELYAAVHGVKPWVKFGVSPFGIWRPGNPPGVEGLDSYREIFADARTWVRNGWLDYVVPQLYWSLDRPKQPYVPLMAWWAQQNQYQRHVWIGNYTSRVRNGESQQHWSSEEIISQIELTRGPYGSSGNVHFSMEVFMKDRDRVGTKLAQGVYVQAAAVPASPWLKQTMPRAPRLTTHSAAGELLLRITTDDREPVRFWVLRMRDERGWSTTILPGDERSFIIGASGRRAPAAVAVSALDRAENEGDARILVLRRGLASP